MQELADRQFWRDIWYRSYKEFFSKTDKKFIRIASSIDGTRLLEFTREDFLTFEDPSVIIESKRKFEAERAKIAASLDARLAVMEANPNSHKISLNYMRRKILKLQGMTRAGVSVCIVDYDHLEELRGSLCDVACSLGNCAYFPQLNAAIKEVHKTAIDGSFAFNCVNNFV